MSTLKSGIALFLMVACLACASVPASAQLYVSSDIVNVVTEYNPLTGAFVGPFAPSTNGSGQLGISLNPAGTRMLVGHFNGGVDEYDVPSGNFIKTYNPGLNVGTQWAGLYAPNGNVYISSWATNDIREYDANTGAFVRVVTPIFNPADMKIGPNGNLFICSYVGGFVQEVHPITGAPINQILQPATSQSNDLAFLPNGDMLVTTSRTNLVHRYDSAYNYLGNFFNAGWGNTHGIEVSPFDGNIYVIDGITAEAHVFDPGTFAEINTAFLSPAPTSKIVDLVFRVPEPATIALLLPVLAARRIFAKRRA